ncbi:MAG: hypothetical protein KDE59_30235 [Anaerolineales bacterium]|nr:hypothetical protein [Anaerolineales bacterium]
MIFLRERFPIIFAATFGIATLLALLFLPDVAGLILGWGKFLAAVALLMGVINLFAVHAGRFLRKFNIYSGATVISMIVVLALAIADWQGLTNNGLDLLFTWVWQPLEAALGSLLAFFLLFAGVRLWRRQRTVWGVLFLFTALLVLLGTIALPAGIDIYVRQAYSLVNELIIRSGMRGILLGVALGTLTLALRLIIGAERPYSK